MVAPVSVMSQSDFTKWVGQQSKIKPPTTPTPTPASPSPTATPTAPATFQELASQGQTVYANSCAVCHGNNGQGKVGPPLWGSGATLGSYAGNTLFNGNAQDMFNFISTKMPLTSPGSLSKQQYLDVLSYLLVQNKLVSPASTFNENQLGNISLK